MRRALPLLGLLLAGGCAYYNGMYNTDKVAGQAERAERQGRTLEANGLWGVVVARAESVLVDHPRAGFSDRARFLLGKGLVRLGDCNRAVSPLERAARGARDSKLAAQAARLAGECHTRLGDHVSALRAYARLAQVGDSSDKVFARVARGRALAAGGRFEAAVEELDGVDHPAAAGERAAALAGAGRIPEAIALAESLATRAGATAPWDTLIVRIRAHDPEAASRLVTAVAGQQTADTTGRGMLLVGDGEFWFPRDTTRALQRFAAAEAMVRQGHPLGWQAKLRATVARLRLATDAEQLRTLGQEVSDLAEVGGSYADEATRLGRMAARLAAALDSTTPGAPEGELRLFLVAELARDSLSDSVLARQELRRIAAEWPGSPYVPKALLALMALEPAIADSIREELAQRYEANPYVLTLQGTDAPGYQVLEDSLARFATTRGGPPRPGAVPGARPAPGRPQPAQPASPRAPVD
jgi:tetratricopeptide (TPR) repeat protein